MLGGISKGDDLGVIDYLFRCKQPGHAKERGTCVAGTIPGGTQEDITRTFQQLLSLREDAPRRIQHIWMSCPPGEEFTPEAMEWVGAQLAHHFGWNGGAWCCVAHRETGNFHPHYVGTRVHYDSTVAREQLRDFRIVELIAAQAEKKFGLSVAPRPQRPSTPHGRSRSRNRSTSKERNMDRAGKQSMKAQLREAIRDCEDRGYRGYRLLLAMRRLHNWQSDVLWRDARPVGLSWRHSTGMVIPSRRLGDGFRATAFLKRIGGIPGMHGARPLPTNWTPPPYRSGRFAGHQPRPSTHVGVAAGCTWWGKVCTWVWQTLMGTPSPTPAMKPRLPNLNATVMRDPQSQLNQPIIAPRRR